MTEIIAQFGLQSLAQNIQQCADVGFLDLRQALQETLDFPRQLIAIQRHLDLLLVQAAALGQFGGDFPGGDAVTGRRPAPV